MNGGEVARGRGDVTASIHKKRKSVRATGRPRVVNGGERWAAPRLCHRVSASYHPLWDLSGTHTLRGTPACTDACARTAGHAGTCTCCGARAHLCTQTHRHTHIRRHTVTQTQTHISRHTHTGTHTDTQSHRHRHTRTHTQTHMYGYTQSHRHRHTHTHTHSDTYALTLRHTLRHTHTGQAHAAHILLPLYPCYCFAWTAYRGWMH